MIQTVQDRIERLLKSGCYSLRLSITKTGQWRARIYDGCSKIADVTSKRDMEQTIRRAALAAAADGWSIDEWVI